MSASISQSSSGQKRQRSSSQSKSHHHQSSTTPLSQSALVAQQVEQQKVIFTPSPNALNHNKEEDTPDAFGHPRIPYRGHYTRPTADLRREWVEKFTGVSLNEIGQWWDQEGEAPGKSVEKIKNNIEGPIGLIKIPVAPVGTYYLLAKHSLFVDTTIHSGN
jgi:hypothetical protein